MLQKEKSISPCAKLQYFFDKEAFVPRFIETDGGERAFFTFGGTVWVQSLYCFSCRDVIFSPPALWATRLASARGQESAVSLLYIDVTPRARIQRVFGFYMSCLH